jgi:HSP20 family molecular chaperone IbpA
MIERDFDRVFNEVFEDLLINRWRARRSVRNSGDAVVVEDEDSYLIRIAAPEANPNELAVEVSEWRLVLRIPTVQGLKESTLDFSHAIDIEHVTARFAAGILEVTVPKARGRKIEVR